MNKDLLVFEELAEKSLIRFENTDRFKITLGLTIMYMGFIRAAKEVKDARFAQFINSAKFPPNRHILAVTILNNLKGVAVTEHMLHESVEKHRGTFSLARIRQIINNAVDKGIFVKHKGVLNPHTKKMDRRQTCYVYSINHIDNWLDFLKEGLGINMDLYYDISQGAWNRTEHMALLRDIGYISGTTDWNEYMNKQQRFMQKDQEATIIDIKKGLKK